MIVGKRMSTPIVTVPSNLPITQAMDLMKKENIRHLIVADKGKMVGLVTENDLRNAMPSEATSLSIWEIKYLIDQITVGNVMIKNVISATENMIIEDAARLMADNKISSLPVLRGEEPVGIITESDLFYIFLELLGARQKGVRIAAEISIDPGTIAKLTKANYQAGGDIIAIGTFLGDTISTSEITIKVQGINEEKLRAIVEPQVLKLLAIRTV